MISGEDNISGIQPQWKMTSVGDDLSARRLQWKKTSVEDDISAENNLSGRQPQWRSTSVEADIVLAQASQLKHEIGTSQSELCLWLSEVIFMQTVFAAYAQYLMSESPKASKAGLENSCFGWVVLKVDDTDNWLTLLCICLQVGTKQERGIQRKRKGYYIYIYIFSLVITYFTPHVRIVFWASKNHGSE